MARYQNRIDVWKLDDKARARLQPGQHISAGDAKGVWCGMTKGGSAVAMWEESAASGVGRLLYMRALRNYATAGH